MNKIIIMVTAIVCAIYSSAQNKTIKKLTIGNYIPDTSFMCLQNGEQRTIRTSDLKGKLVLLDFWSTGCSVCIATMPKMDSLQTEFGDKLQVIFITRNSLAQCEKLFTKIKRSFPVGPMLFSDSLWTNLFPFHYVPHHVWIDPTGKIIQVTDGMGATASNIRKAIAGETFHLPEKADDPYFDHTLPLHIEGGNRLVGYLRSYAMLYGRIPEVSVNNFYMRIDSLNGLMRKTFINRSLLDLYLGAFYFSHFNDFNSPGRISLEVRDTDQVRRPSNWEKLYEWREKHMYSYEQQMQTLDEAIFSKAMLQNLDQLTPFDATIEKRPVQCLLLIQKRNKDYKRKRKVGSPVPYRQSKIPQGLKSLFYMCEFRVNKAVFINNDIILKQDIRLRSLPEWEVFKKELDNQDLELIETQLNIDVLVIRDDPKENYEIIKNKQRTQH